MVLRNSFIFFCRGTHIISFLDVKVVPGQYVVSLICMAVPPNVHVIKE